MRPNGRFEGSSTGLRRRAQHAHGALPPTAPASGSRSPTTRSAARSSPARRSRRTRATRTPPPRRSARRSTRSATRRRGSSCCTATRPTSSSPYDPANPPAGRRRRPPTPAARAVHRRARDRHRRPRHLPDGRARRPVEAGRRRGRPSSRGAASSSTPSAARAGPSIASSRRRTCCRRRSSARGFVVATSSLNIYANNCNDVVSAEAAMMTKELVIERYGPAEVHDGQRRLGGLDAAAPAGRELPRAARRPDHEPGLRGPLGPGASARSTAAC